MERSLVEAAGGTNPTEATLFALAEFYRLTADPRGEEKAVDRLVRALPGRLDYRIRLADLQMANDHYEEAAATLDEVLHTQAEVPLHLILRRARIALHGENRAAASQFLSNHLAHQSVTRDGRGEILDFARDNYLDDLVERLLRDLPGQEDLPREQTAAPIELARFLHERGRREQALETLRLHVEAAGDVPLEKATRLSHISSVLKDLDQPDEALAAINEALDLFPDNHDFLSARADLYIGTGQVPEAIAQLEAIWHRLDDFDARAEIDQRLFSLLRGHYSTETLPAPDPGLLQNGKIQTLAQYHALAAAASRTGRGGDEPPPQELLEYCSSRVSDRAAVPRRIEIIQSMPLTAVGKIFRPALRQQITERVLSEHLGEAGLAAEVSTRIDTRKGLVAHVRVVGAGQLQQARELLEPYNLSIEFVAEVSNG